MLLIQQGLAANPDILQQHRASHSQQRNQQGGQENLVAQAAGGLPSLLIAALAITAGRQTAGSGQQGKRDHNEAHQAIGHRLAQNRRYQVAEQKGGTEQEPEQGGGIALGIAAVAQRHAHQEHHHNADQIINVIDAEPCLHAAASC